MAVSHLIEDEAKKKTSHRNADSVADQIATIRLCPAGARESPAAWANAHAE
jgi:hypothetical protein